MPYDTPQANLPRFAPPVEYATLEEVTNLINNLNTQGINYRITGEKLQIYNAEQDAWHTINIVGAAGAETMEYEAGE